MVPPVTDGESSPVPTANEGETPAEAVEAGVEVVMELGAISAVEEPDDVEPDVEKETVEPEKGTATAAESEEHPDEDPEEEDDEEDLREKAEETCDEVDVTEPLVILKPGEMQEEEDESEETGDEEHSEVDGDHEKMDGEELEETKKGVEAGVAVEDGAKGLVHGSAADEVNEKIEGEHVKRSDQNKDEVADILRNDDDSGGSRINDMENSEISGGLELLVDELPSNCVEEDIAAVFSECGEIKSVRIIRNSSTEKSKDIAFVCFSSIKAADKALTEFKKGIEVKGIKVRVSACPDNRTLFLGNICKIWTKDQVVTALSNIGIQECKLTLPSGYKKKNRGFAFLKFGSHYYARAAFFRLMKQDVTFGIDRNVTVSFYRNSPKSSDSLMEAKRVYLEHVPLSWNEDIIKELCGEYGKILNVDLFQISKNMKNETFSFVEFSSSNSALACVEGINNAKIFDGSIKLSACLARPKNGATSEDATISKEHDQKEKVSIDKGKLTSQAKEVIVKKNAPSKQLNDNSRKITSEDATKVQQVSKPSERERKLGKNKNASVSQRPSKKARNNRNVDGGNRTYQSAAVLQTSNPSKGKRKPGKDLNTHINKKPLKKAHNNRNVIQPQRTRGTGHPAGPKYSRVHHGLGESSRSKTYASDLEPHAGYIPPVNQVHVTQAYDQRRNGGYDIHRIDAHPYARERTPPRSTYSGYTSHGRYQSGSGYIYSPAPTSGSYYTGRGSLISRRGYY